MLNILLYEKIIDFDMQLLSDFLLMVFSLGVLFAHIFIPFLIIKILIKYLNDNKNHNDET